MYDFVNRTVPQPEFNEQVQSLLGSVPDCAGLSPAARESLIIGTYCASLRVELAKTGLDAFVSAVPVLDPNRNRTKYHLVYATAHPLGLIEFKDQSEQAMKRQDVVRATVKQSRREKRTGQSELFADGDTAAEADKPDEARLRAIEEFWLKDLAAGPRQYNTYDFARILERNDWYSRELQQALVRLTERGLVHNLDAVRKRPKNPLNYRAGETLALNAKKS